LIKVVHFVENICLLPKFSISDQYLDFLEAPIVPDFLIFINSLNLKLIFIYFKFRNL